MSNEFVATERNLECSSEETITSSSTDETTKIPSHVVNLKESKTHLFYVIQSDNENDDTAQHLVQIKISKERPSSRKIVSKKMLSRYGDSDNLTDTIQDTAKKTHKPSLASIHKRTDHPSFVVLPEVVSRRRGDGRQTIEKNPSTSENSNETYVVRSKVDNKTLGNKRKVPILFGSLWKRNSQTIDSAFLHGLDGLVAKPKSEEYCDCDKSTPNKSGRDLQYLNKSKAEPVASTLKTSQDYLKKEDLFNIDFVKPSQKHMPQRLRAGQDCDIQYKSCYMCPNMKKIFPPTSSERRPYAFHSNNSDIGSSSTLKHRSGYVKIDFKLVRQCLIYASTVEKCEVLDAIRLRMKSPDTKLVINTIQDIVKFDLFGVQCECRSIPLLEELFWPVIESYQLQTSIARFVNALVSYKLGRNYFAKRSIIRMLIWGDIGRDNIDPIMGDNLIGIMMKLSSSRFQRTDMIKNGLFRWLVQHMEEEEYSASKYHLQCMAGLLRNLLRSYNLENLAPIEMRKLIVLLGRYLDTENATAKRYICDSLLTLFQNVNAVAVAKELNFQRVIQDHAIRTTIPKPKEHLRAIHQLLNSSATSKPGSRQKIDSLSEEDTFVDADLEPDCDEEVDYYPGERLLREKFSGDADAQRKDKKGNETDDTATATNETPKDGRLSSRVFVEHLNCFLPNIDKNRIFPLCNARCADKIKTCSHIGDVQPKKRQPYIPPNSRTSGLPRPRHTKDDSDEDHQSKLTSKRSDNGSESVQRLASKISTISHDKSAAKWKHLKGNDESENLSLTSSTDRNTMEKIFTGQSMATNAVTQGSAGKTETTGKERTTTKFNAQREEILASVSYHQDQDPTDVLNERKNDRSKKGPTKTTITDQRLDAQQTPQTENVPYTQRRKAKNENPLTKSEEEYRRMKRDRDPLQTKSLNALGHSVEGREISSSERKTKEKRSNPQDDNEALTSGQAHQPSPKGLKQSEKLSNLPNETTSKSEMEIVASAATGVHGSDSLHSEKKYLLEKQTRQKDSSAKYDAESSENDDMKDGGHQLSLSSSNDKTIRVADHSSEHLIEQQSIVERKQIEMREKQSGRVLQAESKETLTNLEEDRDRSRKAEDTIRTKIGHPESETTLIDQEKGKSDETINIKKSENTFDDKDVGRYKPIGSIGVNRQPILKTRSERLEEGSPATAAEIAATTTHQLKVRSAEMVKCFATDESSIKPVTEENLETNAIRPRSGRSLSESSMKSAHVKETKIGVNVTGHKLKVRSDEGLRNLQKGEQKSHSSVSESKILDEKETGLQLHVRSKAILTKTKIPAPNVDQNTALNARSAELLKRPNRQENRIEQTSYTQHGTDTDKIIQSDGQFTPKLAPRSTNKIIPIGKSFSDLSITSKQANVGANDGDNKLKVRSAEILVARRDGKEQLPKTQNNQTLRINEFLPATQAQEKPIGEATPQLRARSMETSKHLESADKDLSKAKNLTEPPATTTIQKNDIENTSRKTDYQISKSNSDDLLSSNRNLQHSHREIDVRTLPVRSKELVNIHRKSRTHSATSLDRLRDANNSSQRSTNKSNDCVDCNGSGYVLRARPSQPCDRCKASLTKYPNFVDALNNNDNQRRVVTSTSNEFIKVTWENKSDEKMITKPNQEKSIKDLLPKEELNANSGEGNTSSTIDVPTSTKISGNETKENITETKNITLTDLAPEESVGGAESVTNALSQSANESISNSQRIEAVEANDKAGSEEKSVHKPRELAIHFAIDEHLPLNRSVETTNVNSELETGNQSLPIKEMEADNKQNNRNSILKDFGTNDPKSSTELISNLRPQNNNQPIPLSPKEIDADGAKDHLNLEDEKTSSLINDVPPSMNTSLLKMDEKEDLISTKSQELENAVQHKTNDNETGALEALPQEQLKCFSQAEKLTELNASSSLQTIDDVASEVEYRRVMGTTSDEQYLLSSTMERKETITARVLTLSNMVFIANPLKFSHNLMTLGNDRIEVGRVQRVQSDPNVSTEVPHVTGRWKSFPCLSSTVLETPKDSTPVADNQRLNESPSTSDLRVISDRPINPIVNSSQSSENTARAVIADVSIMKGENDNEVEDQQLPSHSTNVRHENSLNDPLLAARSFEVATSENVSPGDLQIPPSESFEKKKPISVDERASEPMLTDVIVDVNTPSEQIPSTEEPMLDSISPDVVETVVPSNKNSPCKPIDSMDDQSEVAECAQDNQISFSKSISDQLNSDVGEMLSAKPNVNVVVLDVVSKDNEKHSTESLRNDNTNEITGTTSEPILPATSIENVMEEMSVPQSVSVTSQNESGQNEAFAAGLTLIDANNIAVTKPNSLSSRSNEIDHECSPIKKRKHDEANGTETENVAFAEQRSDEMLTDSFVRKSVVNTVSTLLDGVLIDETNLRLQIPTGKVDTFYGTVLNRELSSEGFHFSIDESEGKGRHKVRLVNSTCCRQLLNNDELINRLSDKVLEKLITKIHRCGPNCKSPCAGLNSILTAKRDNK